MNPSPPTTGNKSAIDSVVATPAAHPDQGDSYPPQAEGSRGWPDHQHLDQQHLDHQLTELVDLTKTPVYQLRLATWETEGGSIAHPYWLAFVVAR